MIWILMGILLICLILGFPMYMPMIFGSLIILISFFQKLDLIVVIQQLMAGVQTFALLAIPLFVFAADIMSAGHTAKRLVDLIKVFVGHIYGGLGMTMVGTCTLFGAISGSTQATVVAIGKTMRPNMLESGYHDEDINGLIISAANLAMLIPPSVVMIMYCVVTGASVGEMFIAGIGPGVLLAIIFSIYNYFHAKKSGIPRTKKSTWRERWMAIKSSLLPLGFPIVVVGSIYSGVCSPTEAAAISVLYAFILEVIIYRTVKLRDIGKIAVSTGVVTATLFILISCGQIFSFVITYAKIPQMLTSALLGSNPSPVMILTCVTLFFFVACMFVDPIVAIIVLTPIFYPIAIKAGIDPIQLGIIITLQNAVGAVSPPFGCNIFTACAAFDVPYMKVVRGLPVYMVILVIMSIVLIFFPEIITFYRAFI
jgi:tripartite ATP-independent transporter DctM subunit